MGAPPAAGTRQPDEEDGPPSYTARPGPSELPAYEAADVSVEAPPLPLPSMLDVADGPSGRFAGDDLLPPAVFVLDGQTIYSAADPDHTPVYTIEHTIASLAKSAYVVEFARMEPRLASPGQFKARHIYNLNHRWPPLTSPASSSSSASARLLGLFFVQPTAGPTRRLGSLGLKTLHASGLGAVTAPDQWTVLPLNMEQVIMWLPLFVETAPPLWEARKVQGAACKWVEGGTAGGDVAMEYEGELPRLVITATITRQKRDALVALWCCRLWATKRVYEQPSLAPPSRALRLPFAALSAVKRFK